VTFATGAVVREQVVDLDDRDRRFVYAVVDGALPFRHHQATMQVVATGDASSRIVWITDLLPDELADPVGQLMDQGADAIRRTL
jgi:hypothetical protein